jgi:hypothetical protein
MPTRRCQRFGATFRFVRGVYYTLQSPIFVSIDGSLCERWYKRDLYMQLFGNRPTSIDAAVSYQQPRALQYSAIFAILARRLRTNAAKIRTRYYPFAVSRRLHISIVKLTSQPECPLGKKRRGSSKNSCELRDKLYQYSTR